MLSPSVQGKGRIRTASGPDGLSFIPLREGGRRGDFTSGSLLKKGGIPGSGMCGDGEVVKAPLVLLPLGYQEMVVKFLYRYWYGCDSSLYVVHVCMYG